MSINFKIIGRRIKEVRKAQGISQEKLAELADLSTQYMSQIETAARKASLTSLVKISNALNVSLDELLYGNRPDRPGEMQSELDSILSDCDIYEKRVLYELVVQCRKILKENKDLLNISDSERLN